MIERRPSRRAVAAVAMAALAGLGATAHVGAQPAEPVVTRTFTARAVRLGSGQNIAVHLHPTRHPIRLRARTEATLEACPIGWPRYTGFVDCLSFADGALTLPSVGVDSFHLGFFVQTTDGSATRIETLAIEYEPGDGYFLVDPPPLAPGTKATFVFTPSTSTPVGVAAYRTEEDPNTAAPNARLRITQGDRRLRKDTARPPGGRAPGYGPVRLGEPVQARVTNTGASPLGLQLEITWD